MTWLDDIEVALERGGSFLTSREMFHLLRMGWARMYVGQHMHGGVMVWPNTKVGEFTHVCGSWDTAEALEMLSWAERQLIEMGCERFELTGRKGWLRFLERKGIHYVGRWFTTETGKQHDAKPVLSAAIPKPVERVGRVSGCERGTRGSAGKRVYH